MKHALLLICLPFLLALESTGCPTLLDAIRDELRHTNPQIQDIQILDTKRKYTNYWVIARGIVAGGVFDGDFEDELFSLLVVDETYSLVLAVVDVMPTPRWRDYDLWIESYDSENVSIRGHGTMYNDQPFEKSYRVPHR